MRRSHVKSSATMLAVAALLLAGCSSPAKEAVTVADEEAVASPTATAEPAASGARGELTQEQADAAMPTVEAITAEGWEVGSIDDAAATGDDSASTYSPAECDLSTSTDFGDAALVPEGEEALVSAKAEFKKAGEDMFDLHGATVELKSYKSEVDSEKLEAFAEKLKDCANFTITDDQGITSAVQILPVSLPNYADSTLAFKLQASVSFLIVIADIAVVASGHNVLTIAQVGLGGIDPQVVSELAGATMANLETATA